MKEIQKNLELFVTRSEEIKANVRQVFLGLQSPTKICSQKMTTICKSVVDVNVRPGPSIKCRKKYKITSLLFYWYLPLRCCQIDNSQASFFPLTTASVLCCTFSTRMEAV